KIADPAAAARHVRERARPRSAERKGARWKGGRFRPAALRRSYRRRRRAASNAGSLRPGSAAGPAGVGFGILASSRGVVRVSSMDSTVRAGRPAAAALRDPERKGPSRPAVVGGTVGGGPREAQAAAV